MAETSLTRRDRLLFLITKRSGVSDGGILPSGMGAIASSMTPMEIRAGEERLLRPVTELRLEVVNE